MRRPCPERSRRSWRCSVLLAAFAVTACAGPEAPLPRAARAPHDVSATAWPEADELFRSDPRWLGGDGAVSIELDADRVLWLFGDSFVAARGAPAATRAGAQFVRNSVALQRGRDPSRAALRFYTGEAVDGAPASFFAEQGDVWFWPGHGLYRAGVLTVFLMRVRAEPAGGGLGFRVVGWSAVRIAGADADPDGWRPVHLATPDTGELRVVGASVLLEGDHVYAYAVREPGDHAVMLLRWDVAAFDRGDLSQPSWFAGEGRGFSTTAPPAVVLRDGAPEFSVSPLPAGGYVQVQSRGFGPAPIALRFASALPGPFGAQADVYLPDEAARPQVLLYAARAHPELAGADLVITYATNTLDPERLVADLDLYFPRFVRLDL